MILRIGPNLRLRAFVDASFDLFEDGKSVTGVVIMLGDAMIYLKSGKQKIVTRSSTKSKLVGISDSFSQVPSVSLIILLWGEPVKQRIEPKTKGQGGKVANHEAIWP
jgi:hypothetical protein